MFLVVLFKRHNEHNCSFYCVCVFVCVCVCVCVRQRASIHDAVCVHRPDKPIFFIFFYLQSDSISVSFFLSYLQTFTEPHRGGESSMCDRLI